MTRDRAEAGTVAPAGASPAVSATTVYDEIGEPPSLAGGFHRTVAREPTRRTRSACGGPGPLAT